MDIKKPTLIIIYYSIEQIRTKHFKICTYYCSMNDIRLAEIVVIPLTGSIIQTTDNPDI